MPPCSETARAADDSPAVPPPRLARSNRLSERAVGSTPMEPRRGSTGGVQNLAPEWALKARSWRHIGATGAEVREEADLQGLEPHQCSPKIRALRAHFGATFWKTLAPDLGRSHAVPQIDHWVPRISPSWSKSGKVWQKLPPLPDPARRLPYQGLVEPNAGQTRRTSGQLQPHSPPPT